MKQLLHNIIIFLNVIAVASLMITYLSVYISPAVFWIPAFFGLAYPYILLVNVFFMIYWLFRGNKMLLLSAVAILLGISHIGNYFRFRSKVCDESGLVVYSYNVKHFSGLNNEGGKEPLANIKSFLQDRNADIICLQEVVLSRLKDYNPFTGDDSSAQAHMIHSSRRNGPVILSRYPIVKSGDIIFGKSDNMIVFADVNTGEDTVRVYSCHLQSYRITDDDINRLDSISFRNGSRSIKDFRMFAVKLKQAFIKRTEHADTLRTHIRNSPYPVVVCGDFNDTPVSYTYRVVSDNLKDAFVQSGVGTGNSYLGRLPSFRIDYILHDEVFNACSFTVHKVAFSDHYPVSCTIVRKEKTGYSEENEEKSAR